MSYAKITSALFLEMPALNFAERFCERAGISLADWASELMTRASRGSRPKTTFLNQETD
jgi:hypothetical protein